MGGANQFGTNTCHHNNKLDQILNHLHLFWDFSKSMINEYNDNCESPIILSFDVGFFQIEIIDFMKGVEHYNRMDVVYK